MLINSPIEPFVFENVTFWLKRDDLLDSEIDGNKARKFHTLLNMEFREVERIVSYGGAQSNAMYSLSALAKRKNLKFHYYTTKLSTQSKESLGNLKEALKNGMLMFELSSEEYDKIHNGGYKAAKNELFVPQGGACALAR